METLANLRKRHLCRVLKQLASFGGVLNAGSVGGPRGSLHNDLVALRSDGLVELVAVPDAPAGSRKRWQITKAGRAMLATNEDEV